MINISIICIGKLKEKFTRDAVAEYSKRMGAFAKFNIIELDEKKLPDKPSQSQINATIEDEGKRIIQKISTGSSSLTVAMCIEGKMLSSEQLASYISNATVNSISSINFIIGGSWGLSPDVKKLADLKLSVSAMTFPHQLFRVMLCEQIYRAFMINNSSSYHK